MEDTLLIRLKQVVKLKQGQEITLQDIAHIERIVRGERSSDDLKSYKLLSVTDSSMIIDRFFLTKKLKEQYPHTHIHFFGPNETLIKLAQEKQRKKTLFLFAWLLVFIGATMTMMNFHFDVNMQEVHIRLHYLLTGEEVKQPLFIQVPYALGLAVGMFLFLNESFLRKKKAEPSPLELEMYQYDKNIANYLNSKENKGNK